MQVYRNENGLSKGQQQTLLRSRPKFNRPTRKVEMRHAKTVFNNSHKTINSRDVEFVLQGYTIKKILRT